MYTPVFELESFTTLGLSYRLDILRALLEALIVNNRIWLRQNPGCPPMYEVALHYKLKVRPFGLDTWQDIPRTLSIGSADCKDFACWRCAEMREKGFADVSPRIKVMKDDKTGLVVYHIQVRQDLNLEDPSAIFGMPDGMTSEEINALIQGSGGVDGIMATMGQPQNHQPAKRLVGNTVMAGYRAVHATGAAPRGAPQVVAIDPWGRPFYR